MTGFTNQSTVNMATFNSLAYGVVDGKGVYVAVGGSPLPYSVATVMTSMDGVTWTSQASPTVGTGTTTINWTSVVYGTITLDGIETGLFVAVADNGNRSYSVMTSRDGVEWTFRTIAYDNLRFTGITYGVVTLNGVNQGLFVAVDTYGRGIRSTDGVNWERIGLGASNIYCVTYGTVKINDTTGNGFILLGKTDTTNVYGSFDGATWTRISTIPSNTWNYVIYGGGKFVAVGLPIGVPNHTNSSVIISSDGTSWSQATYSLTLRDVQMTSVAYGPSNGYIAVGTRGEIVSSQDLVNWSMDIPDSEMSYKNVLYSGGKFVAIVGDNNVYGYSRYHKVATSSDGISWSINPTPYITTTLSCVAYGIVNGEDLYVAISSKKRDDIGSNPQGTQPSTVLISPDGVSWSQVDDVRGYGWVDVVYGNVTNNGISTGLFVAVANNVVAGTKSVMTSPDGIIWTYRDAPLGVYSSITFGGGRFVAVSTGLSVSPTNPYKKLITSTDGINWTIVTCPTYDSWSGVTYGTVTNNGIQSGLFVAVGSGSSRVMTSTDGLIWSPISTSQKSNIPYAWKAITFGNGMFVAVSSEGYEPKIMTSVNGRDWIIYNSPILTRLQSICYGNGMFMGLGGIADNYGGFYSTNGENWQQIPISNGIVLWSDMIYGKDKFVAVSNYTIDQRNPQTNNVIMTYAYDQQSTLSNFSIPTQAYGPEQRVYLSRPMSNSNGPFSYTSSNTGVCIVDGESLIIQGVGDAVITATQGASLSYPGGATISTTFVVEKGNPNLNSFTIPSPQSINTSYTLVAPSSNSNGAISYSVTTNNASLFDTISGTNLYFTDVGTVTVKATQSATPLYNAGYIEATTTVKLAPGLSNFTIPSAKLSSGPVLIPAPSKDTDAPIEYTTSDPTIASVAGNVLTLWTVGTVTITAAVGETAEYVGGEITASFTVLPDLIDTELTILPITNKTYGDVFNISAMTTSDAPITYSTTTPSVVTISGSRATMIGVGSANITASQNQTETYTSAQASVSFSVQKATTHLSDFSIGDQTVSDVFTISPPQTNSNGAFSYTTTNTSLLSIQGNQATVKGVGLITVTAVQSETSNYTGSSIETSFRSRNDTVMSSFSIPDNTYGNVFTIPPPITTSDGTITYFSATPSIVTITGTTAHIIGTGTAVIIADQAATNTYNSGNISASFTVSKAEPTYGSFSLNIPSTVYQNQVFTITPPSSTSQGTFTFTSSNVYCTVSKNKLTIQLPYGNYAPGLTFKIHAHQDSTANYMAASKLSSEITINTVLPPESPGLIPVLSNFTVEAKTVGDAPFTLTPPVSESPGTFTYAVADPTIATIDGDQVIVHSAGTTEVTAYQASANGYGGASIKADLVVYPGVRKLKSGSLKKMENGAENVVKIQRKG